MGEFPNMRAFLIEEAARSLPTTGWAEPHLARAYFAVEAAIEAQAQCPENPISEALKAALTAIEDADVEIALYSPSLPLAAE